MSWLRLLAVLLAAFVACSALGAGIVTASEHRPDEEEPPEQPGASESPPGNGNGQGKSDQGPAPAEDEDSDQKPGNRSGPDQKASANDTQRQKNNFGADDRRADQERRQELSQIPADRREMVGAFDVSGDTVNGRHVSFVVDVEHSAIRAFSQDDHLLALSIIAPDGVDLAASELTRTKEGAFEAKGDGWRLRLADAPTAPLRLETDRDGHELGHWLVSFPEGTVFTPTAHGVTIIYAAPDGAAPGSRAFMRGDVERDGFDALALVVTGKADFVLRGDSVVLGSVANRVRGDIHDALEDGRFGAEVSVLRAAGQPKLGVVADEVLYTDMLLDVAPSNESSLPALPASPGLASLYTITVDAEEHEGKTIAVNFESGLVAAEDLVFRYFNVDVNRTVQATIVRADSISDVLDPLDDGPIAEYWVIEDIDGIQVLVSIPHFSIHQIELLSAVEMILAQPNLALGIAGGVILVSVATYGMFRRPDGE